MRPQVILSHNAADDVLYQHYNRSFWARIHADEGFAQDLEQYKVAMVGNLSQ